MEPEHKEILIWAGGAILALLVGLYILSGMDAKVRRLDHRISGPKGEYAKYQTAYVPRTGSVSSEEAKILRGRLAEAQEAELRRAENRILTTVPDSVPKGDSYPAAVAWAADVMAELKGRARGQNLQLPKNLPFADPPKVMEQDPDKLKLQVLQVFAMDRVLNHLIDAGPRKVELFELVRYDFDPDRSYLVLPFYVTLIVDLEVFDQLVKDLAEGRNQMNARQLEVGREPDGTYRLTLQACIVLRRSAEFERLPEPTTEPKAEPKTDTGGPPSTTTDGGGRGGARPSTTDQQP